MIRFFLIFFIKKIFKELILFLNFWFIVFFDIDDYDENECFLKFIFLDLKIWYKILVCFFLRRDFFFGDDKSFFLVIMIRMFFILVM